MVLAWNCTLESANGVKIPNFVPRKGGLLAKDVLAIPMDATHPQNAEKWRNYSMGPEAVADISNDLKFPYGNPASQPFGQDAIKNYPAIYPDATSLNIVR